MKNILAALTHKEQLADLRLKRARATLDAAERELADVQAAIRVINGLAQKDVSKPPSEPSANQDRILSALQVGKANGRTPKEVSSRLSETGDEIAADYVRTTLWRMAKSGRVASADGRYWFIDSDGKTSQIDVSPTANPVDSAVKSHEQSNQPVKPFTFADDMDDDVPF